MIFGDPERKRREQREKLDREILWQERQRRAKQNYLNQKRTPAFQIKFKRKKKRRPNIKRSKQHKTYNLYRLI